MEQPRDRRQDRVRAAEVEVMKCEVESGHGRLDSGASHEAGGAAMIGGLCPRQRKSIYKATKSHKRALPARTSDGV